MSINPFGSVTDNRIVDETAIDTGQTELVFTADQLDNMSNTMLRRLAAELDTDAVNGKSTRIEIRAALACQKSLEDF